MPGKGSKIVLPLFLLLSLFVALFPSLGTGEITIPDPGSYVVDQAGIIEGSIKTQLEGWLRELEQKTTAQVKVLTVASTEGEDFFTFVHRHAERWKLGKKGQDNGALIALAVKERRVRIHTGYGLEAVLPDSWAGSLSRAVASQFFKQGNYSQGLLQLVVATANKVADAQQVQLTGIPQYRFRTRSGEGSGAFWGAGLFPLLIVLAMLSSMMRRRRYYRTWGGGGSLLGGFLLGSALGGGFGGRRSHWGGYSGGVGGGFGGGFGGSFGSGGGFGGGGGGAGW